MRVVVTLFSLLVVGCAPQAPLPEEKPSGIPAESAAFDLADGAAWSANKQSIHLRSGIDLSYLEAGDPAGEPVVFLHGYTDTSRSFATTMEALVEAGTGLRLLALDLRGHGDSSMPSAADCAAAPERCFRALDFSADVIDFMTSLKLTTVSVVGHSMGSVVAQELALGHPDRVRRLVLIGTFVDGTKNPVIHEFLSAGTVEGPWKTALEQRPGFVWPRDAYDLRPLDADPSAESWMRENWVVDPIADPEFLEKVLPETLGTRLGTWIGALRALAVTDNRERLARLRVPTLVLWATQDAVFLEQDQLVVRAALDRAVQACGTSYAFKAYGKSPLPDSGVQEGDLGHNLQWAAPAEVASDIAAFLDTGRPTSDLPYGELTIPGRVRVDPGSAVLHVMKPPASCSEGD